MSIDEQRTFLERLAKGISTLFGINCEVTVHDFTEGYESSIIAIENGHVTGRRIGDGASEMVLQALSGDHALLEDQYSYLARTKEGRMVKSSTIYLRDENDKPVGIFGINYDITNLIMAQKAIEDTISVEKPESDEDARAITTNVTDLLDQLIEEADAFVGKPVAMMTKDDKTRAIQHLSGKGAFLIKKAGDKVSKHYDISKYTLYNYMDAETKEP
ncbi:helix-turn-helix transcriptional regulator [Ruminococcaceae bacterium OttesenSCG-928-D13]|nr:helix-turn-helix transcriptional regulator [Ruminococcaceae bacterium OttesenSCG-928-D13]